MECKRQPIYRVAPFFSSLFFFYKLIHFFLIILYQVPQFQEPLHQTRMESEAPSWADQWGAGGIGALTEDDAPNKEDANNKKKKAASKSGLNKAKAAAMMGATKIKTSASTGFKWVKSVCQKKGSPK